ncbi:DAK2 domain-containing protein [Riemerella anatipestifer]|nr:DAK2 domain-containing protein [Riemerella anatipestifer]MDR7797620.1 DAK2 domain-containing protein [Riemerella anatipestifer]MEE3725722.1 DAK2 domain-containing protein [Riemerella anatipestifer]
MSNYEKSCVDAIEGLSKVLGNALPKNKDTIQKNAPSLEEEKNKETLYQVEGTPVINNIINTPGMVKLIDKMADIIIAHEVDFCEADRNGDGDFGMSIAKGFKQLKKDWDTRKKGNIGEFLMSCSEIIMEYCGGASGPLWGNAFRYAGKASIGKQEIGVSELAELLQAAVIGIQETGERSFGRGAKVGDKTLIDALVPAADSLKDSAEKNIDLITAMKLSADAAKEGAEKTKGFAANLGRAGTVGDRSIGYPDAGAYGIGIIFSELYEFAKDFK